MRDREGSVNVVENRCAHRGVQFCQKHLGNAAEFMCPYHQWTYDLKGNLIGVPFRIVVGKKLAGGLVELVERKTKQSTDVPLADAAGAVQVQLR